ncbi:uncharacterized protein LOC108251071 isoform X1 [Kryptolebias marmoratus]|uniref:uncharacterized protein LOC108251071 isoform X1 n=2 Tax=Kryptolebias marmoratus TaxID=37003 RepID=UPI0018ACB3BB|nr:uncharacterized protein LOC108251071 isoform X1 [Kryptolebias marmoratus]
MSDLREQIRFLVNLFCATAKQQRGQKMLELLSSVCSYTKFPLDTDMDVDEDHQTNFQLDHCNFLLDLCFRVKNCEAKTGLRVLPSLQPVFQSTPPIWIIDLSERKTSVLLEVLKLQPEKKQVKLTGCSHEESEVRSFLQCLPYISQLSIVPQRTNIFEQTRFMVSLFCAAAETEQQTGGKTLVLLSSVCRYETFPLNDRDKDNKYQCGFLLDLYSHLKNCEAKSGLSLLPSLRPVFQSAPAVWIINLSERKTSVLLEVLKLQPEKKQVELTGCSHEESEVRSLLQCLPFISHLSFASEMSDLREQIRFLVNLFCATAKQQRGQKMLELLSSVCSYTKFPLDTDMDVDEDHQTNFQLDHCNFLLDLCFRVKNCEAKTGLRVLPSLQPVFQSTPPIWIIDLSERKTSVLLEVLKLQPEKKQVELTGCSHEDSEVRSFLQCLPYISQFSLDPLWPDPSDKARFLGSLLCAAAEREQQTGEKTLEMLSSVYIYETFSLKNRNIHDKYQCDFLMELYTHVKDCEVKTGLRVLPFLQSVFQSAPAVWIINLSERKTSVLLEVLKLQPEKKQVELTGCSHEETEVRSLLQCLPYISRLSFVSRFSDTLEETRILGSLFCAAAEREQQRGEKILELLSSVCTYRTFLLQWKWTDFVLDLYICGTKTNMSFFQSLDSVFQSARAVWSIDLSERKTSVLLEVLKLQSEKKQVELTGCSHEEGEVRSFLKCLPFISQLSVDHWQLDLDDQTGFFGNLFCAAAEREQETGEKTLELLLSVCSYETFPLNNSNIEDDYGEYKCDFLLDLFSHLKDSETKTGLRVLPSVQAIFLSTPLIWIINLSERKTSVLLEVLKLQPEKKQVKLTGCSHEESEVRSLLQCLPFISQLSFAPERSDFREQTRFMVNLFCAAAEREQQTGGKILKLLSSVCSCRTSPFTYRPMHYKYQGNFLLDLYCRVKECETKTGLRVLPSLQPVFQSTPPIWIIDLSERKTSVLLEVLKLQPEKKQVKLTGCSHEESEVKSLLQCLPYISRLRPSPRFVRTSIRQIYRNHNSHMIPSLLRSLGHVITLSCRELDSEDCAALLFVLDHSDGVKLKLLWTSIPTEGERSILFRLHKVSDLSVDRRQLLRFIHCCAASDEHQEAASHLLKTLGHSLDLSCSSCVELPEEEQPEPLRLTAADCRAISTILKYSSSTTQLHLKDCEVEDGGLELLFPVLDRLHLKVNNAVLVQLLLLLPGHSERDTVRRAMSLCTALGRELDLSHTTLDQRLCGALVQMLDVSEGLTELDLSHCQLTDQLLLQLLTHLHKVHVLDLSHNEITDASTDTLLRLVSINSSTGSVRLFCNNIVDKTSFKKDKKFEIW